MRGGAGVAILDIDCETIADNLTRRSMDQPPIALYCRSIYNRSLTPMFFLIKANTHNRFWHILGRLLRQKQLIIAQILIKEVHASYPYLRRNIKSPSMYGALVGCVSFCFRHQCQVHFKWKQTITCGHCKQSHCFAIRCTRKHHRKLNKQVEKRREGGPDFKLSGE